MTTSEAGPGTSGATEADDDPIETREWLDSIDAIVRYRGPERALFLLQTLETQLRDQGVSALQPPYSAYRNTIPLEKQGPYPGDLAIEERLTSIIRWNALAMVVRANRASGELGGHIASYASAAEIFETGFNHFFRAAGEGFGGDLVFFQPHSAPGVYARAFLEGRLSEDELARYRQEVGGGGLSSYPHPWLMPDFWQFPTGSMGLGVINAIYQARFMRYLEHRGLMGASDRRVWGVYGDGELDEPESTAALTLAAREKLDNLTFIVNCNLQRLDGPVRGNGQIIQELESLFTGAGWNVIKVLWGSDWDALFARDKRHVLLRRFAETVDGEYQNLGAHDGDYNRAKFFQKDPDSSALVETMTDDEINALKRGGHDFRKLYAAFSAARAHKGQPTVILAKTKKGFGMGAAGESRMTAHQSKKLDIEALLAFRDRFGLPLEATRTSPRSRSIGRRRTVARCATSTTRRAALGGFLPARRRRAAETFAVPPLATYAGFATAAGGKEMSTTMAVVRILGALLKDRELGPRIVPIVADEARTFGMASLFRQIGIYAPQGQLYEPEDAGSLLSYREAKDGQLLEEGITEAGALSSWTAAATAYSVHGLAMLPFYIYYSMFGFQRVGDLIWAAADQRARGFLLGATAGRTTLAGEGLQHQDGASHVMAALTPNCRAYDPAFAYELAVIIDHGLRRMIEAQADEFYYLTVMNENYAQPSMPARRRSRHRGRPLPRRARRRGLIRRRASGCSVRERSCARRSRRRTCWLRTGTSPATSSARRASANSRARRPRSSDGTGCIPARRRARAMSRDFSRASAPIVAASDYVRAYPMLIAAYVEARFVALGTDGFGRSDTRAKLRRFFEVDRRNIALAALQALAEEGTLPRATLADAIERYGVDPDAPPPWTY